MKTAVSLGQLNEMRKNLNRVMRYLHLTEKGHGDVPEIPDVIDAKD